MPNILQRALSLLTGDDYSLKSEQWLTMPLNRPHGGLTERELLRLESKIGATLFGTLAKNGRREFFNLDEKTWIWYEEWQDQGRNKKSATTRYEIQDNTVMKVQEGARYSYLEGQELENLRTAISLYYERVAREIYRIDPDTGQPITSQA